MVNLRYDKKGNPTPISHFVARPVMEVVRDDGVSEEITVRIDGVLAGGKPLKAVDIPALEFGGMNWVYKHWGIKAAIRPGQNKKDFCRDAIRHMAQDVYTYTFTHLGWRRLENCWFFYH